VSTYRLTTHGTNTDLLDLPYGLPLAEWDESLIVHVPRGISRHIVRFVEADGEIFAVKEATDRFVLREHSLLRVLADRSVPVVDAYGTVVDRTADDGSELPGLLLTKHLTFSLPYALAELFVRLHLAGFYWGDCSLSNTLFRRDAGALAAYLVDAETGELHPSLSNGQRANDLAIATENIAGEMFDLEAGGYLAESIDPITTAIALAPRYEQLWDELNRDEVVGRDESYRINTRVRRLNSLGFDVAEMEIRTEQDGRKLRFETQVVEPGHHQRSLFRLTGLRVQENEARALLADLARFRAKWEEGCGEAISEEAAARRWLTEKYHATLELVPAEERGKMPDAELFHEINEHRWFLSEAQGHDIGRAAAVASYVDGVLRFLPDMALDLTSGPPTEEFEPIFD
jgi:hypothetical protein